MEEKETATTENMETSAHSFCCLTEWLSSMSLTGWLLTSLLALLILWIWKSARTPNMFSKMGIPFPKPLPIIGNGVDFFKWGFIDTLQRYSEQYGKVYGMLSTNGPAVVVADLDMLKEIMVKEFQHFPNRAASSQMSVKPWSDTLLQAHGDHWKHMRATLSPTFSSGKIKRMMSPIQRVCVTLKDYLNDTASGGEMLELKEICGRYSMDVIGAAAFGIDVSSIRNPEDGFVKHANAMINPNKLQIALFMFTPKLSEFLVKWGLMSSFKTTTEFFTNITNQALQDRQRDMQLQRYHDFLQLLVESENEGGSLGPVDSEINHGDQLITSDKWNRKGLTRDEMLGNALLFLLAGYDTVSTTIAFTLFCLANNPECLKEAQAEVDSKLGKEVVTYDLANELTYVEMCISEAIRLYPPGFILSRAAVDEVEIGGLKIPKDMGIVIPVTVLHTDPDVWPQPEKFDPLRHTSEARAERHPLSFLPFGLGPRNCIGMRLAQLEVRMAVATVLQHFTPLVCEKTVYPAKVEKFRMRAADGLWVKLQKRE